MALSEQDIAYLKGGEATCDIQTRSANEIQRLRRELAEALRQIAPSNPDETLVGAIRNLQQVALANEGNVETLETMLAGERAKRQQAEAKCAEYRVHLVLPAINRKGFYCRICQNDDPENPDVCTQDGTEKHSSDCLMLKDNPGQHLLDRLKRLEKALRGLLDGYAALRNGKSEYPWTEAIDEANQALTSVEGGKEG